MRTLEAKSCGRRWESRSLDPYPTDLICEFHDQPARDAEPSSAKLGQDLHWILDSPTAIRFEQDSQYADHGYSTIRSGLTAAVLIHEKKVGVETGGQMNGFGLSPIQSLDKYRIARLRKIYGFEPCGSQVYPLPHTLRSCTVNEILLNSTGDQDSVENVLNQIHPACGDKVAQRRGIGDGRHLRTCGPLAWTIGKSG